MTDITLEERPLPIGSIGAFANGYWGMIGLIVTEAALFVYLEFSYYYYAVQPHAGRWPPDGPPSCGFPCPILFCFSTAFCGLVGRARAQTRRSLATIGWYCSRLSSGNRLRSHSGARMGKPDLLLEFQLLWIAVLLVTGFHMAHVVVGLLLLIAVTVW